ncbi:MAG: hypothetical protein ABL930_00010 [Pseudobdellovibrio sp.]
MNFFKALSVIAILLTLSLNAHAEILFEGYYKVTQFKKHIGFLVLRHEIDDKTKNFKTTSFIKLGKGGFDLSESYQAVSTGDLAPVSINYLAAGDRKTKTIDVKFKDQKMTGMVVEDGKKTKVSEKIPKGVFLSSALYYLMLKSKDGLKNDSKFDYVAITEEGPVAMKGTVNVDKKMTTQGSLQLLKISNYFAGSEYDNLVTSRGEVVSASTPATSIESELVKTKEEATDGVKLAAGTLEKIFGDTPSGKINVYQSKGK